MLTPECPSYANTRQGEGHISSRTSELDVHVGGRVRHLRERRGLSRETLASNFNISHQQFQKYETGKNRISAGRLYTIAGLLGVPISYFYEGLPEPHLPEAASAALPSSAAARLFDLTAECVAFLEMFVRIQNPATRRSIVELVLSLAANEDTR
jgi:transcriptional regulator with XRE-family HTH domain